MLTAVNMNWRRILLRTLAVVAAVTLLAVFFWWVLSMVPPHAGS